LILALRPSGRARRPRAFFRATPTAEGNTERQQFKDTPLDGAAHGEKRSRVSPVRLT
jgi:hypothetical protein